jgi:hypothetical protein
MGVALRATISASAISLRNAFLQGRPAVSISSFANGAFGLHRRHDTVGIKLEIEARVLIERAQIDGADLATSRHEKLSHGTPAAIATPIVG